MKKVFFSLLFASSVILVGCSKNDPESVAKEWLTDFYHMDFEAAKKLSTDDTKDVLSTFQGFTKAMSDSVKQRAKKAVITINGVKTEGDKATITFITSEENKEMPPLKLVKQNDRWLVQFTKVDWMGGGDVGSNAGATINVDNPSTPPATQINVAPAADTTHK